MQSNSNPTQLADVVSVVKSYLASNDVDAIKADDVVAELEQLVPVVRQLQVRLLNLNATEISRHSGERRNPEA